MVDGRRVGETGRGRVAETKEQKALVNELPHPQSFESRLHVVSLGLTSGARELFNSKLPGNYTSVTVLS